MTERAKVVKVDESGITVSIPTVDNKNIVKDYNEEEEGEMKVTEEFISELRALAKRQKAEASVEEFTKILGNGGRDIPKPSPQESQINALADEFEIEEE